MQTTFFQRIIGGYHSLVVVCWHAFINSWCRFT